MILNYNHIILGNFYLLFSLTMFIISGIIILGVRMNLFYAGINILSPEFFNSLITLHGIIMIFGVIIISIIGLSYWILPCLIFYKKMYLRKTNILSLILLPLSSIIMLISIYTPVNFINTGWTIYTPLILQLNYNVDLIIISLYLLTFSTLLNSVNIIITIINNFNINIKKITIFLWCLLVSSYLIILTTPVLLGLISMILFDKYFNTSFFNPVYGGNIIMYQHIFWFFGHPEVYIMIIPSFGIVSQIIPVFSKKKIFSYNSMVYSILSISILSLLVWGHHMFMNNSPILGQLFFMYCTILISIPTGIKIFNWLLTLWRGNIVFESPLLFSLGFIIFFTLGGFSGVILSLIPLNIYYHSTYFVVAHFHYILVSTSIFSIYSFWYYWSPLILNKKYSKKNSKIHFWISFIFVNLSFFPMHFLGLKGMPRRYSDFNLKYNILNKIITINSLFLGFSQVYFIYFIFIPLI